jgi:uncharacterized Zn-binding protein involved in type VI secretion
MDDSPWWLTGAGRLLIVPSDIVMSRVMLRGVKARAEGRIGAEPSHRYKGLPALVKGTLDPTACTAPGVDLR